MWEIVFLLAVIWFGCGYLAAGYVFAYFQREYEPIAADNLKNDTDIFVFAFVFGVVSLVALSTDDWRKHGRLYPWQVKRNTGGES